MWYNTSLASALLIPTTLALHIESHLTTSTTLLCSTLYSSSSISGPLPTSTISLPQKLDLSPVVLHNYTSSTVTVTPKPFSTLFSVLATKTKTTEVQASNGTLFVTETRFGTSTHWEHETTTKTATATRLLTTRTTKWINAPTGFVGVRDGGASSASASLKKQKRSAAAAAKHPHSKRQTPNKSKKSKLLTRPTSGLFAVEVICKNQAAIHTTEVLLLTASKPATVTLRPETVFKNRTVYGTVTSTILVSGSGSASSSSRTLATAEASSQAGDRDTLHPTPSPSPSTPILASMALTYLTPSISTNRTTITKTPYTISFTYTRTVTTTCTQTLHATTTLTSYAACATANLISNTFDNKLINGVSGLLPFSSVLGSGSGNEGNADAGKGVSTQAQTRLESLQTLTPSLCCESCITLGDSCLWSIWQAEGKEKGSCYLFLLAKSPGKSDVDGDQEGKEGEDEETEGEEAEAEQQCKSQNQAKALFGYRGGNGEVRYVVSNGLCGMLSEA